MALPRFSLNGLGSDARGRLLQPAAAAATAPIPRNSPSYRRRPMGVERLDGLQPPGLALLALFLGPDDRLPVRREDEAGAGVGDFDAVAPGLVDVEEEGLLDRVLVR